MGLTQIDSYRGLLYHFDNGQLRGNVAQGLERALHKR